MQDHLDLWTMMARGDTKNHNLWAMSGTLRANPDEPVQRSQLVRAEHAEFRRQEREHHDFLVKLWTDTPKAYDEPNWTGRLSPTVTYYTQSQFTAPEVTDNKRKKARAKKDGENRESDSKANDTTVSDTSESGTLGRETPEEDTDEEDADEEKSQLLLQQIPRSFLNK